MDNIDDEEQKLSVAKEELNKLTVGLFAEFSYLSVKLMFFLHKYLCPIIMQKQLEKAEDEKSRLQLAKLSAEDSKREASKSLMVLQRQGEQRQEEFSKTVKGIQVVIYLPVAL